MTTATLAPIPKQQFFDSNGDPLNGGLLYTYAPGTATKQTTYTDPTASTANVNPVVLDSRGEANVWLDQTKLYKLVLAPSTDTDPPTNSIWTVDSIGGILNSYTLTATSAAGLIGYTASGAGAVSTQTVQSKLREITSVKDFGAIGDNSTDDTAAFNAAITFCRANNQRELYIPTGHYNISSPLNVAGVPVRGEGAVASTLFRATNFSGAAMVLLDGSTVGNAVDASLREFRIDGNLNNVTTAVAGLMLRGNVIYNTLENIRINNVRGTGVVFASDATSTFQPNLNQLINVHVATGSGDGWEIRGSLSNVLIGCAAEAVSSMGFNINSADTAIGRTMLLQPWVENVGNTTAIYIGGSSDNVKIIQPLISDYGSTVGSVGHGIHITGSATRCEIVGPDIGGRTTSAVGSRKILIDGGGRHVIRDTPSNMTSTDCMVSSAADTLILNSYNIALASIAPIFVSNASSIANNLTRFIQLGTGAVDASESAIRMYLGQCTLMNLRVESTVLPSTSESFTIALMKNNANTALTVSLTTTNGGISSDLANEVSFVPGDFASFRVITSVSSATIPISGLHMTVGVRR